MPNKYYLREDRKAVVPTMKEPNREVHETLMSMKAKHIVEVMWNASMGRWEDHLQSLAALDVDPDYLKRLSTGWFEGEERYEENWGKGWTLTDLSGYLTCKDLPFVCTRLTIVAPQEAENGQEGEVIGKFAGKIEDAGYKVVFGLQDHHIKRINEETSKWEKPERAIFSSHFWEDLGKEFSWYPLTLALYYFDRIRPATPQPVTGEDIQEMAKEAAKEYFIDLYGESWEMEYNSQQTERKLLEKMFLAGAASRPSDAVASQEHREEVERLKARVKELEELLLEIDKSLYVGADLDDTEILKWYIDVVAVIKDQIKESVPIPTPPTK